MELSFGLQNEIDYSKWQRKSLVPQKAMFTVQNSNEDPSSKRNPKAEGRKTLSSSGVRFRSPSRPILELSDETSFQKSRELSKRFSFSSNPLVNSRREIESSCSSRCRHLPSLSTKETQITQNETNLEQIRALKFQIKAKKQCMIEYRKQILNLVEENVKLKKRIQDKETSCHDGVRDLLEKYQKLCGAMGRISQEHSRQKAKTDGLLSDVKQRTEGSLCELETKLSKLQADLLRKQNDLRTLNNYKNKEYPEKVLRIRNLNKELEMLSILQRKSMKEMDEIIEVEKTKYEENANSKQFKVIQQSRSHIFDIMDPSTKELALQNIRLKKEIEIHKSEKDKITLENAELEIKIERLIEDKHDMRCKQFPGVFPSTEKCLPDTEIDLSIPRKQFIPI